MLANRRGRELAFVGAGIPRDVDELLLERGSTYLQRAFQPTLGLLTATETRDALRLPIDDAGRSIEPDALTHLVENAQGYPYAVQLLGQQAWLSNPSAKAITLTDAQAATNLNVEGVGYQLHHPTISKLPRNQRAYLAAVAKGPQPTRTRDIIQSLAETERLRILFDTTT
ncbi:MAG: hypothetical protein V3V01_10945 [Acidimicrobiales bacterium]